MARAHSLNAAAARYRFGDPDLCCFGLFSVFICPRREHVLVPKKSEIVTSNFKTVVGLWHILPIVQTSDIIFTITKSGSQVCW